MTARITHLSIMLFTLQTQTTSVSPRWQRETLQTANWVSLSLSLSLSFIQNTKTFGVKCHFLCKFLLLSVRYFLGNGSSYEKMKEKFHTDLKKLNKIKNANLVPNESRLIETNWWDSFCPRSSSTPVSYTHLTLPTKRIV